MALFDWDNSLSVGVNDMDLEHKEILSLMNLLYDRNSKGADRPELDKIFTDLLTYTVKHFSDEERFMESINYDGIDRHKIIHTDLLGKAKKHYEDFKSSSGNVSNATFDFLRLWLSAHIRGVDTQYGHVAIKLKKAG